MISLKNRILNFRTSLPSFDLYVDVGFFLLLCAIFVNNTNVENQNYFYYFGFFLFVGLTFIKLVFRINRTGNFVLPTMTLWYALFTLLGFASILWADYPSFCVRTISRSLQCMAITFCMAQHYSTKAGLTRCLKMITWTSVYAIAVIFARTPSADWFSGAFGLATAQLNPNTTGMILTISTLIAFYFAYYTGRKKYYLVTAIILLAVVLTSSRKSLLCVVFGLGLLVIMNTRRRHYILHIVGLGVVVAAFFYLIMNVPQFYTAIGRRFETMFEFISTSEGDNSMALRRLFIQYARELFFNHVFFGVGLNNFSPHLGQIVNFSTYAHNNYYEILADLGIVGFVVYYSYYFYMLASLWKILRDHSSMAKLMLAVLLSIMICEYGLVSFYSVYMQVFLCCVSMFISSYISESRKNALLLEEKVVCDKRQAI